MVREKKKETISVAIATFNEETNIRRCLSAVYPWVDEIIIVDGGSSDKTVEIARSFGKKVKTFIEDNPRIFHINKQRAIERSSCSWILQLDADEVVSSALKKEILKAITLREYDGFWIPRKNFFLGRFLKKGGAYPDHTLRLYRKGKAFFPCKSVHEQVVVEGKTGYLKEPLLHYPYRNFSEYIRKALDRYSDLLKDEFLEKKIGISGLRFFEFFLIKPFFVFTKIFLRHRGFEDGFPGFVWALFSALHYPIAFIKYWEEVKKNEKNKDWY